MKTARGLVVALALLVASMGSLSRAAGSSPASPAAAPALSVTYYFLPG